MNTTMRRVEEKPSIQVKSAAAGTAYQRRAPLMKNFLFVYFRARGAVLMVVLTMSLLFLPLVLPPLPPPPLSLLLIPVAIMAVLVCLAFTPPQRPNAAYLYV